MHCLLTKLQRLVAALVASAVLASIAPPARGGVVFYTTQASFDAAAPSGLAVETFSTARVSGTPSLEKVPVNSATNDSIFHPGEILPGITVSTVSTASVGHLVSAMGPGGGSKSVGNFNFDDPVVLSFTPGVTAVGANVFADNYLASRPILGGSFSVDVYTQSGQHLNQDFNNLTTPGEIGYLGIVSSSDPITSVQLVVSSAVMSGNVQTDGNAFVSNVAFGPQTSPVPEPSSFLLLSSLVPVLFGLRFAARPRTHPVPTASVAGSCSSPRS